ncbi:MAG: 3-phosphoshikimate 1-carboxyvinyltransferase [Sulfolobales archaeon]
MKVYLERSKVSGRLKAPRSKSHAIRLIFSSLLSPVEIEDLPLSDDVRAAIRAVEALGVRINGARFETKDMPRIVNERIYVGGSATTLRILIPIITVIGGRVYIDGDHTLRRRPLDAIVEATRDRGVNISSTRLPIVVEGRLDSNWIRIRGSESSQYISGYMIAFCLKGYGDIYIDPPIVSKSYIYLTRDVLRDFGCNTMIDIDKISVERVEKPSIVKRKVEGDYALSSFYVTSALITGGSIEIYDLPQPRDYFGDHSIVEIYRSMGAYSRYIDGSWHAEASDEYNAISVDIEDAPDLGPSIAPVAAMANGITRIGGVERLRIKESNRIETIINTLRSFNIRASYREGFLEIEGQRNIDLKEVIIDCGGDHRIAMMASTLALKIGGVIENAECVNKSNPSFWNDLRLIGGVLRIED